MHFLIHSLLNNLINLLNKLLKKEISLFSLNIKTLPLAQRKESLNFSLLLNLQRENANGKKSKSHQKIKEIIKQSFFKEKK